MYRDAIEYLYSTNSLNTIDWSFTLFVLFLGESNVPYPSITAHRGGSYEEIHILV